MEITPKEEVFVDPTFSWLQLWFLATFVLGVIGQATMLVKAVMCCGRWSAHEPVLESKKVILHTQSTRASEGRRWAWGHNNIALNHPQGQQDEEIQASRFPMEARTMAKLIRRRY